MSETSLLSKVPLEVFLKITPYLEDDIEALLALNESKCAIQIINGLEVNMVQFAFEQLKQLTLFGHLMSKSDENSMFMTDEPEFPEGWTFLDYLGESKNWMKSVKEIRYYHNSSYRLSNDWVSNDH